MNVDWRILRYETFFDENLSHRLTDILIQEYPDSIHVRNVGLRGSDDVAGPPPKVIWLDVGNAGTRKIGGLLQNKRLRVKRFVEQQEESLLILSIGRSVF